MNFVYDMLLNAKTKIENVCNKKEIVNGSMNEIIERRSKYRLDSPLHFAVYLMNHFYFIRILLLSSITLIFYVNPDTQDVVVFKSQKYIL